ncbi:MAG: TIGR02996 domain-containing protein [Deltaproteobacteria bacterium]|nr:TIGR02996 domain-containing protein [Deltaproteobacteria bacterium]
MLGANEIAAVRDAFPIQGDNFRLDLVEDGEEAGIRWADDQLLAVIRLTVFEDGVVRDIKEQTVVVVPARHRDRLGAFLAGTTAYVRGLTGETVETWMPMDLFVPTILDSELPVAAYPRVLSDRRARMILERRRDSTALRATLDPATWPAVKVESDATFEARIRENLDDVDAFSVYGDWLTERGDPRGELVALQIALASQYDGATAQRVETLLELYGYEWLGNLAWTLPGVADVTWRNGFVDRVVLGQADDRDAEWEMGSHDIASDLREIGHLPSTRFVRSLEIRPRQFWDDNVIETIGALQRPLRSLSISTNEYSHLGEFAAAYPALSQLEELRLESRSFQLGAIELPALRSIELATRGLTRENLDSLRAARWPHLEKLIVWLGNFEIDDCNVEAADYQWLLVGDELPALKYLGLCGRSTALALIDELADAPIVKRLEVLDLSSVYFDEAALELLTKRRDRFAHLREMHVSGANREALSAIAKNLFASERFLSVYE